MFAFKAWESHAVDVVTSTPHIDVVQIHRHVVDAGFKALTRRDINQFLYGRLDLFAQQVGATARPVWARSPQPLTTPVAPGSPGLDLYPWQHRALAAWGAAGQRGVIEAVTGTGKTRLAVAAAEMELRAGGRVVVLVHTRELLRQWQSQLATWLRRCGICDEVGVLSGGSTASTGSHRIIVATAHSAAKERLLPPGTEGLLIVDEVHHYAAATWQLGLQPGFARRLGLTATYERDDDGVGRVLDPYFHGKCYGLQYKEALDDRIIAQFKVALVGVDLTAAESLEYRAASKKMRRYRSKLISGYGAPEEPYGDFLQHVSRLAKAGADGARLAGFYLGAMAQRRGLLAAATEKLARLHALVPAIRKANRSILFAQTRQAAADAIDVLAVSGVRGAVLDAKMALDARADVFAGFEDGRHELIAAPQLLDEGVDVPAADLAIVLAASRSRRQMIQRLGRVLRKKQDGRLARLVIFYVRGTFEDPAGGGHEAFLDVVTDIAADVRHFDAGASDRAIVEYLNDRRGQQEPAP